MPTGSGSRTLFFFEKPSAKRQLQRFFRSPSTVCVAAEGHLLTAEEPGEHPAPSGSPGTSTRCPSCSTPSRSATARTAQASHTEPKVAAIRRLSTASERVIIATRSGSRGLDDRLGGAGASRLARAQWDCLKLGALDDVSIRRAFAALAKEPDSGERDFAAYLEALCRQYEDHHLGPERHPGHLAAPAPAQLPRALALRRRADTDARTRGRRAARCIRRRP